MKRFLAWAALAACALCLAVPSWAGLTDIQLKFRESSLAISQANPNGNPYADSSFFSWNGSASETTATFTLPNLSRQLSSQTGGSGVDSTLLMRIWFAGTSIKGSTTGADNLGIVLQGSFNGEDWVPSPTIGVGEINSQNVFEQRVAWNQLAAAATTPSFLTMGAYPIFRIIFTGSSAFTGQFIAGVRYWKDAWSPAN